MRPGWDGPRARRGSLVATQCSGSTRTCPGRPHRWRPPLHRVGRGRVRPHVRQHVERIGLGRYVGVHAGKTAGCTAVTIADAVVAELQASRAGRLALPTPYPQEMTLAEVDFLEKALPGLSVVSHRSMGMTTRRAIGDLEPRVACQESRPRVVDGRYAGGRFPVSQRHQPEYHPA